MTTVRHIFRLSGLSIGRALLGLTLFTGHPFSMSHSVANERPAIPSTEELAQLPPDGGDGWNRLVFSQSPYLLQHAANPVDWWPWGEEAFDEAKRRDVPVFLSVGYSTCHWCHVMERESFEDEEVAAVMNEAFVCIKVDREERPDIDQVYMTVTQAMTQQGGWPMTVIMTPEKKPFFAGTYFPKSGVGGRPGMLDIAPVIANAWKSERESILKSAAQITEMIQPLGKGAPGDRPDESDIARAFAFFSEHFDAVHGGFEGGRNKFPTPHNLSLILRHYDRTGDQEALKIVRKTLKEMRLGGIFDHIGFGFHRYSTDQQWLLPHFEKMLYDQAMLLIAYTEAWQATGDESFRQTADEIVEYVLRDLQSPGGGFYSAEDADSEGEEGKFYVWSLDEVMEILGEEDGRLFAKIYNFEKDGNFEDEATGHRTGDNIPHLRRTLHDAIEQLNLGPGEELPRIEAARAKLFTHREKRVHPYKDDKVLTDWNGLFIAALAKAGGAFNNKDYIVAAERAANFVVSEMTTEGGRLVKRWRQGKAGLPSHLEDYAFMVWGLLNLYEATFNVRWLQEAIRLNEVMIEHFHDEENGGFFLTADDSEELIVRTKEAYDGVTPSGNSAAAYNLTRIARITGNTNYEELAWKTMEAFGLSVERTPYGNCQMLIALDMLLGPSREIVLAGDETDMVLHEMAAEVRRQFLPRSILLHRPSGDSPAIADIAEFVGAQPPADGKATAYVCRNYACELPVTGVDALAELLQDR